LFCFLIQKSNFYFQEFHWFLFNCYIIGIVLIHGSKFICRNKYFQITLEILIILFNGLLILAVITLTCIAIFSKYINTEKIILCSFMMIPFIMVFTFIDFCSNGHVFDSRIYSIIYFLFKYFGLCLVIVGSSYNFNVLLSILLTQALSLCVPKILLKIWRFFKMIG
jgi:hypothetical protein